MVVAPSTASAASVLRRPTCRRTRPASLDTTAPSSAWQQGVPAGTVDVPLLGGGSVDQWQYKVDCGAPVTSSAPAATATIIGDGTHRFTHRAHDSVTGIWTDWVDHFVQIDSGNPSNTTTPPTASWRRGPVNFPLTARRRRGSPVHTEWRVDGDPGWTTGNSAHGQRHRRPPARDRRGRRRRQPHRAQRHRPHRQHASRRHHRSRPVGWQNGAVDVPVTATDADSGVDHVEWQIDAQPPGSGPEGTVVRIGTHGIHNFRTRVVDEVGNASAWVDHTVMVNIAGPADTTVIPSGWITDPSVDLDITADPNGSPGIQRIQWRLDGVTTGDVLGHRHDARDGHRRRRPRARGAHHRRLGPHQRLAHAPGQDRHRRPRSTTRPSRPAGSRSPTSTCSCAAPTSTRRSRASSGASTAATSSAPPRTTTRSASRATAPTRSRPASSTTPAAAAPGRCTRSGWTRRCRPTPPRPPPRGWRNTPYSVVLDGSDAGSGVASVSWQIHLEGEPAGDEHEGARGVARAEIDDDGTHMLQHPHPRRRRQLLHLARRADPHRPRAPDRRHGLSVRARRQPPRRHLQPAGRPLRRRRRSSASSTAAGSRPPPRRRSPAPARTR